MVQFSAMEMHCRVVILIALETLFSATLLLAILITSFPGDIPLRLKLIPWVIYLERSVPHFLNVCSLFNLFQSPYASTKLVIWLSWWWLVTALWSFKNDSPNSLSLEFRIKFQFKSQHVKILWISDFYFQVCYQENTLKHIWKHLIQ